MVIVAIGVFLGLAVNQWQGDVQKRQLAREARAALRSEMLANRALIFARMRRIAALYRLVASHPDQAGNYVLEGRNRTLILADSEWTLALDSGALRWLTPAERTDFAGVYAAQTHTRELAVEEMSKWTELAAFAGSAITPDDVRDRTRAVRVWLAYAQRVQLGQCIMAGRYERAFGATARMPDFTDYCAKHPPDDDPARIYSDWARRRWSGRAAPPFQPD